MSLLTLLEKFPPESRFIPVRDKNPAVNGSDWQSKTLDAADIVAAWETGVAPATGSSFNGVGLVLSPPFVAIDHDGESCDRLIADLSGMSVEEALPPTLTISSGKPGRYQKIYLYGGELTHRKINTGTKGPDGKMEQLEIRRGDSKQSVIFGSHPETSGYTVTDDSAIAPLPAWVVAVANGVDAMAAPATPLLSIPCANNDVPPIPLERCLSKSHRALLEQGVIEGGRDNAAIEIAMDALGCERWLQWERIPYVGSALDIVTTFAQRCSPPLGSKREDHSPEQIMKSAQKSGNDKGPSTPPDGLRNVIKKWERENRRPNTPATKSTPAVTPAGSPPDDAPPVPPVPPVGSLRDLCIEIAQRGIGGSELDQELIAAAQLHRVHPSAVRGMFDAVAEEVERAESRPDVLQGINSLQAALDRRLDPAAILPKPLADLMSRWADSVNIKVEGLILGLLSGISGMHHPITRFIVNEEFRVPPAIWFALLAPTGEMKTPILNKVIGEPLGHLDWKEKEIHDAKMKDWKQRRDRAKRNKEEFTEEPPVRIKLLTNDCTYEQGALQMSMQPNGINFHYDELTSLHESLKRSEHRGDILNLYNGNRISKMKVGSKEDASDRYTDVDSALAVYNGGCQIEVLKEFLARGDRDGFWARYFFSYQPSSYTPLVVATDEDEIQSDGISPLCSALIEVYSHARLLGMSPCFFRSNREAAAVYTAFNDEIEARRLAPGCPEPFAAILAKCRGSVARLAMSLQMIWDAHAGVDILNPVIGGFIMRASCEIIRYHLSQVEWVYAEAEAGGVEFLEYKLQKILEISNGQPIGVSDCKRRASAFRGLTAGKVKGMFGELVELGLGRMEGEGRTAKFVSTPREKERNQKVTSFAPQNDGRGHFGQNPETHTGGSIESPYIGDINQNNQINHPYTYTYKDNTKELSTPLDSIPPSTPSIGGGEFGQFGQFDLKPSDSGASKITEPVNGAVHLDRSVQNSVQTLEKTTLPPRAIARFNKVKTAAELTKAIHLWGQERFDAFMAIAPDDRRAFLQQLTETTHD